MMPLRAMLSDCWRRIQGDLFPWLEEELGPLSDKHKQIITVFEVARIEVFVEAWSGLPGRPPAERAPLARSFVAKAVLGLPTTAMLIERLDVDKTLRRLCGWQRRTAVPIRRSAICSSNNSGERMANWRQLCSIPSRASIATTQAA